jgi:disulfide bond formation protein DsbB
MRLENPFAIALAIFFVAVASITGALVVEALGYAPCELCLKERIPYYAAIPITGLAAFFAARGRATLLRPVLLLLVLIFAASAIFGAYHAGIEWGFWPGPIECGGILDQPRTVEDFLAQLQSIKVTGCHWSY